MSSLAKSRSRRKVVASNEERKKKKKNACVTLWSEEDDISLLKGMVDYEVQKQSNPYADMGEFFAFVKPSLHFDVQRKQLTDRLRKLKNRCLSSSYDISKPHHAKLFELAKLIKSWGYHENVSLGGDKSENVVYSDDRNGEKDSIDADVHVNLGLELAKRKRKFVNGGGQNVEEIDVPREVKKKDLEYFTSMYPELTEVLNLETLSGMPQKIKNNCVIDTINSMGREKANQLEGKWADLCLMELELHAKKQDLINKQIDLVLEAKRR